MVFNATFNKISVMSWQSVLLVGWFVLFYGVYHHFQQYLSYIVAVSFIGGRNQMRPLRNPKWSSSGMRVTLSYLPAGV